MSDFTKTVDLLARAGLSIQSIDMSTISYWLDCGYSPERIAHKIYSVPKDVLYAIQDQLAAEATVRMRIPVM